MSISNKIKNKRSSDPFDILIHEKGLRIKNVLIDKDIDLLLLILNNGFVVKEALSQYPKLQKASAKLLKEWRLISGGIGISWESLGEDLSATARYRKYCVYWKGNHL